LRNSKREQAIDLAGSSGSKTTVEILGQQQDKSSWMRMFN